MNREETRIFLLEHEILPAAKFGQNFLCDEKIIDDIVSLCDIRSGDKVIEIGPGIGALTRLIRHKDCSLTAVEIDRKIGSILKEELSDVNVVVEDFLKFRSEGASYDIAVSNIPYYVMTPIMNKLLTQFSSCRKMVFMVEEEAIRRIAAEPGTKQYGPLAVLVSLYGIFKKEFTVPSSAFYPMPHTSSAVISLTKTADHDIPAQMLSFLEPAFGERRKKMINPLSSIYPKELLLKAFESAGIKEDVRAEQVLPKQFLDLFSFLNQH